MPDPISHDPISHFMTPLGMNWHMGY